MAGGVEYDLDDETANSWPAYRPQAPFGQLPVMTHGDVKLAQSGAINRYCARLAGLYPEDPVEASKCDMMMDEAMDIFQALFKAKLAEDKDAKLAQWKWLVETHLPSHYKHLEKLLADNGKPYFGGDKPNASDVMFCAVQGIYDYSGCGSEKVLDDFPRLKSAIDGAKDMGNLKDYQQGGHYFCADPENPAF